MPSAQPPAIMAKTHAITCSTEVLIVGAGPAGLMAAITLARYGGVDFRLIDKEPVRKLAGHASAFQPRTQEIIQTMHLLHELDRRGHRHTNTAFWETDDRGRLDRKSRSREVVHSTPYPYVFNTDQGITEEVLGAELAKRGHAILRPFELLHIEYSGVASTEFPVHAHILNVETQQVETWEAKYLLGTDGARSATRTALGAATVSSSHEHVWAVADVFVETDFPDYRCRAVIRSQKGGCMLIPRKDNGVRIFTQLAAKDVESLQVPSSASAPTNTLNTKLVRHMQTYLSAILHPYTMTITGVLWQSHYRVAQRLLDKFRDTRGRVFVLGDACHTHSPKAGQGLNISMQDAYNLTWKLALVLKGHARAALLDTYESERRHIALQLIDFDVKFAGAFAGVGQADAAVMHGLWETHHGFTSGLQHAYFASDIVRPMTGSVAGAIDPCGRAAEPLAPGKRLLPVTGLVRCIDGNEVDLLDEMPSNGRFHVVMFARKSKHTPIDAITKLMGLLSAINKGATKVFAPEDITNANLPESNAKYLLDLFVILGESQCEASRDYMLEALCAVFPGRMYQYPAEQGGRSYHGEVGVGSDGALVLVRPDGYISLVTSVDVEGVLALEESLKKVFVVGNKSGSRRI